MLSGRNTHWCYRCRRPGCLHGRDAVCPGCNQGFVQELDDIVHISPLDYFGWDNDEDRNRGYGVMLAISTFMRQRMADRSNSLDIRGRSDSILHHNPGIDPLLIFGGQIPFRMSGNVGIEALFNGTPGIGRTGGNTGDYFIVPGLEELFEQLSTNDRQGPPPALRSSIDAMVTIKISHRHLRSDSHCAVCKEKFELGSEARLPSQGLVKGHSPNTRIRSNSFGSNTSGRETSSWENHGRRN